MERQIIELIQCKHERGIELLLKQYGGLLQAITRRYLAGRPQEIEECIADIVIAIWFHISDYDEECNSFKNWIAAIAKFKSIDRLRKIERERTRIELLEPSMVEHSMNKRLREEHVHELSTPNEWDQFFDNLPSVEQEIFRKYYIMGYASKEIAEELKVKQTWIHNKLSRGRKKLRALYFRDGG